ncbi:MAG: PspC domain-containing protein [Parachlamydiales bacterium]|jgi:phage shock protein PspC (stress-responsive transcriptional regulator)
MKKLYRSQKDKKIAGICSGLGQYFSIDPTIIRLIFVLLAFITAVIPFLIIYLIGIFIIPINPEENSFYKKKKLYRSNNRIIAGICSGFGEYFSIDYAVVRIFFLIITLITAVIPMVLLYLIAWIVIPQKPKDLKESDPD